MPPTSPLASTTRTFTPPSRLSSSSPASPVPPESVPSPASTTSSLNRIIRNRLGRLVKYVRNDRFQQEVVRTLIACAALFMAVAVTTFTQIISDQAFLAYSKQVKAGRKINGKVYAVDPLWDILQVSLPDLSRYPWLLDLLVSTFMAICLTVNFMFPAHARMKYQGIIGLRRIIWIAAFLYLFRMLCYMVTTVPSSAMQYCAPADPKNYLEYLSLMVKSFTGVGVTCTDQIYSGHTAMTVLIFLATVTYGCRWYFTIYAFFHGFLVISSIILTRFHYTVDIMVAIFMAVFVYYTYHLLLLVHSDQHILHNQYISKERIIAAGEDPSYLEERRLIMRLTSRPVQQAMAWIDGLDIRSKRPDTLLPTNSLFNGSGDSNGDDENDAAATAGGVSRNADSEQAPSTLDIQVIE